MSVKYKKILLKVSGELLSPPDEGDLHPDFLLPLIEEIKSVGSMGVSVAIVIGGGNFWRGGRGIGKLIDRVVSDKIGMLATIMNGLALQAVFASHDIKAHLETSIAVGSWSSGWNRDRALENWTPENPLILAGGTGCPFFTTDTTAALRAVEIGADCLCKATKVDGVYSADPMTDSSAEKLDYLGYNEVLQKGLEVMDGTAIALCRDQQIRIAVYNMHEKGNLSKLVEGGDVGTWIGPDKLKGE